MAKKILVIDDEPNIVMMVENRLKANGYEVITAGEDKRTSSRLAEIASSA